MWDGSAKIHFFEISSHQAWGIYKSQQFIQLLLCMKHRELLIIALSNAVTLMASETDAQEYLKYWKFNFNSCSGGWVK